MAGVPGRRRWWSAAMLALLALTGFTALALQVTWQRLVSLHVGVEATATAVVVASTLLGLGIGSLVGGGVVARLPVRRALVVVALGELCVAVFALVSPWLLTDLFTSVAPGLAGTPAGLALSFTMLVLPSVAMGVSLPVLTAVVVDRGRGGDAGRWAGVLYAANTAGAALGALVAGWYLVGSFGFDGAARRCAVLALVAAGGYLLLARALGHSRVPASHDQPMVEGPGAAASSDGPEPAGAPPANRPGVAAEWWYLLYGLCGLAALALQQSMFRLVGGIMRSNSYSFPTVLALYLVAFAAGTSLGAAFVRRVRDPGRVFLWIQFAVGVTALASLLLLAVVLPASPLGGTLTEWFNSDGYASGFDFARVDRLLLFAVALPSLVVVVPVGLMGASFPFVERVVVEADPAVGRSTGRLIAAGTLGNVAGVAVGTFLLLDQLGTAGTHLAAAVFLSAIGLLAAARARTPVRRFLSAGVAVALVVGLLVAAPSNTDLWRTLVAASPDQEVIVAEDVDCASVLERYGTSGSQLVINGASQNGHPFDDFHVLIGLVPSLLSTEPGPAVAVGFGAGSTAYGLLADERRTSVTSVELCGGHYVVADRLARDGVPEYVVLADDPRHTELTADGRRFLATTDQRFDTIVVDTLRTTSAGSGAHFSSDFLGLAASRLGPGGVFVEWIPTLRTRNSAALTFPYLVALRVEEYNDSVFMVGSDRPIAVTPAELVDRFDRYAANAFPPVQRARLRAFLADWTVECINDGAVVDEIPAEFVNRDLQPRDEFHLDNGYIGESQTFRTCEAGTTGQWVPGRPAG